MFGYRTSVLTETKVGLAGVVLACLVAVDPFGWDRFGPLRFALVSAVGFGVVAAALRSSVAPRWPRSFVAGWVLLLGGLLLSTLGSSDPWHALIGTPDRHFGLLTWILCAGLFLAASIHARSALEPVSWVLVIGATLGGLYSIAELFGIDAFDSGFAGNRAGGPFGQPAFLGAAMALAIPVAIARGAIANTRPSPRMLAMAGAVLGTVGLAASQSRAAWVGVSVAVIVAGIVNRPRLRDILPIAVAVAAIGLIVVVSTPLGERAWSLTDLDDGVVAGRIDEWQVGAAALFDSETGGILGFGPEGYRTTFGAHVDEQYVIDHGRDTITDRGHNGLLDTALAGGVVAALGLALLHGSLALAAVRFMRVAKPLSFGLAVAVLAYIVQQMFLFPLAELDPAFWILAGLLAGSGHTIRLGPGPRIAAASIAGLLSVVALVSGTLDVLADHRIDRAVEEANPATALALADDAGSLRPDSIRYDFIAGRIAAVPGTTGALSEAIKRIDDALDISPTDPALLTEHGLLLLDRARLLDEPSSLDDALDALALLDRVDPNHPANQQRYGIALALDGQTNSAIVTLEHAAALAPLDVEPLINLAVVQFESGDIESGFATLDRARAIAPADPRIAALQTEFGG